MLNFSAVQCVLFWCFQVRPSSMDLSKCYAIVILVLSILYNYMWASLTSFKGADPQVITIYMHISIFDSFPTIWGYNSRLNQFRWRWNCSTPSFMPPPSSFYLSSLRPLSCPKFRWSNLYLAILACVDWNWHSEGEVAFKEKRKSKDDGQQCCSCDDLHPWHRIGHLLHYWTYGVH